MTINRAGRSAGQIRIEQLVSHPLVIAIAVIVGDIFINGVPQMSFANRNNLIQASLPFYPTEAL